MEGGDLVLSIICLLDGGRFAILAVDCKKGRVSEDLMIGEIQHSLPERSLTFNQRCTEKLFTVTSIASFQKKR